MRPAALLALGLLAGPAFAQEDGAPLSAIDWLSRSVEGSSSASPPPLPPVASNASPPGITVTPLDGGGSGTWGILPPEVTGLPVTLWSGSDAATLIDLIHVEDAETLPALQELLVTLMLAEAAPPRDGDGRRLFLARVDRLLDMGALEAARSLLESDDLLDPEAFRRYFDVSLLTGTEADACALLGGNPALAPTLMARVFCTARNGDWNAAVLTLNTGRALGDVSLQDEALLTRFLDPEFAEPEFDLPPPARPSPLVYRLREAVGDLIPTDSLPLAFSHADLRDTVAWRARIESAERLARHGAISENVLLAIYTAREPAASGGVWDRADAIQRLDRALAAGDAAAVSAALAPAWTALREVRLEVPFARLYGEALLEIELDPAAEALAHRIALLSPAFARAASMREPADAREALWKAIATGQFDGTEPTDAAAVAVVAGFRSDVAATPVEEGRTGEAILRAIAAFGQGVDGDHRAVTEAIATFRAIGLEETARRAALQLLILDRLA